MTKKELRNIENLGNILGVNPNTHKEWFLFCDHMKKWYYKEVPETMYSEKVGIYETGRTLFQFDSSKMIGSEAIKRIEKYVLKHPNIRIVNVDDDVYAGSIVLLIPHPEHGISLIFVPQCTEIQNRFFMYPSHISRFLIELEKMQKNLNLYEFED